MKGLLLFLFCCLSVSAFSQITITATDMPVSGDTLRYSTALGLTSGINVNDSGANVNWVYDTLRPLASARDDYKSATSVNITYGLTISPTAFGYKVADSIPGLGTLVPGLSITEIYTFFNRRTSPSRYVAEAFAAKISSLPVPANYSDEDEIYYFPLTYPHSTDSSTFAVNISLPIGTLKRKGYRVTRVDGWGTIKTPFYTTAVNCIRVRSHVHEIDTVHITTPINIDFPITMDTVEYKWLTNTSHYPALWVTQSKSTGALTSVTYRDSLHSPADVKNISGPNFEYIRAYPNPATQDEINLSVPLGWQNFTVSVYDLTGRNVATYSNSRKLNIARLAKGTYNLLIVGGSHFGYTQIVKE